ncbi:MAG: hypothetical protein AMS18_09615 [Gemmatimonas sp. SG8_17]|nr:MAG: hypothetical protein AMS18_09615 [Gemmatimonas sp. SG8_17]
MFEYKALSAEGIAPALEKAEHYRLLNEPWEADSICRDILAIDPHNQQALVTLILALTERLGEEGGVDVSEPRGLLPRLQSDYERAYYAGIICERHAKERLSHGTLGSGPAVFELLREAMDLYEQAERLSTPGNDDALLRWNTCARMIFRNQLRPPPGPPGDMG